MDKETKGLCGPDTEGKLETLRTFMHVHMGITKSIFKKYKGKWLCKTYLYFDLNAGPGEYSYGEKLHQGSPLIALQTAKSVGIDCCAVFIDNDKSCCQRLRDHIREYDDDGNVYVHFGDQSDIMFSMYADLGQRQQYYGLMYMDPPGNEPHWDLSTVLGKQKCYEKIDFLYYLSATNMKRVKEIEKLHERITQIPKDYWLIRKPVGAHQWTFLFGCNWGVDGKGSYPQLAKQNFVRLEDDEGYEVLRQLSFTHKELGDQK